MSAYKLEDGWTKADAVRVLESGQPEDLAWLAITVSMDPPDLQWSQAICVRLALHDDSIVRGNAVLGFGHLARTCRALDEPVVRPLIQQALSDPARWVRDHARAARDDTITYLNWAWEGYAHRPSGAESDDVPGAALRGLVLQRLRNRMVESLELTASFEAQARYQAEVPAAFVPAEVLCAWEDCIVDDEPAFPTPPFSLEEREAAFGFHEAWTLCCRSVPDVMPPLQETQMLPQWDSLRAAAATALWVFRVRGHLPEDILAE